MRSRHLYAIVAAFVVLSLSLPLYAQSTRSEGSKLIDQLEFSDISWNIPKLGVDVVVDTLPNGMVLFMMEDHRLPVFNIRSLIRTGEIYMPEDRMGLIDLVGTVMRTGGTTTLDPDKLNEELEYLAASVETSIDNESGSARLNCMSKDVDRGLELFADVLMNPAFNQERIDLQKDKMKESIRRRNDSPGSICGREFNHLIYADHPYGSILEWEHVRDVTREDMLAFHKKYYVPNNVWLGITGDFSIDEIKAKVASTFESWKSAEIDLSKKKKVNPAPKPGVYLIDKDLTQSNIRFGQLGVNQYSPDRFAISIMNYILGGGSFTSRMTTEVRSNMGLAYSVGSRFSTGSTDLGSFYAYCQTKTETTYKAVSEMVRQINSMKEAEVTDFELNSAKDSYINSFVFNFTDPSSIVAQLMNLEFDGMPRDYYDTYLNNVRSVTKQDVLAAAKKYLDPKKMTFLVVGNSEGFESPLDEFGTITMLELKEPHVE
ncbi:MAG: insulinase family protein [candidate division Zixibacteria bacterium]|nr:insulinase family protein [candidate division Zixibacteria bacterium]MBU1470194.1 insulinase family protein [candidate division Zixibacteria bacterium]MBU2625217.1 insulinase family protein [candidate division Zixibacteria bacterium]